MSEQLKFYKGNESNLPSVLETGAIYHCLDTGNTYLATSATTKKLFATNVLTLADLGIEASAGELNYMDGVTSNVQDQFDAIPKIYVQNNEPPADAPEGSLWVDLDAASEWLTDIAPSAPGIAAAGTSTEVARADHIHPMQTKTVYATSSTGASSGTKIATTVESIAFSLVQGARVSVKFSNANTTTSSTYLNVNSTGAKLVRWRGATLTSNQYWASGQVVDFVYDGSYWNMIGAAQDNSGTNGVSSLTDLGVTATATELNYVDGVTSAIQTQLNGKAASSHDQAASTITTGTFPTTAIYAKTGTDYTTGRIRNIKAGTSDPTSLANGDIYLVYE